MQLMRINIGKKNMGLLLKLIDYDLRALILIRVAGLAKLSSSGIIEVREINRTPKPWKDFGPQVVAQWT